MIRRISLFVFSIIAVLTVIATNAPAQSLMTRHVRDVVLNGQAQAVGRLPQTQTLQVDIVLPLRDPAGLDAFVADVYDPFSPNFRHFLTPDETSARFGPTQESWDALVNFAKANGFRIENGSLKKRDLVLSGTVSVIESAFHVTMRTYQHPTENRIFFSPDCEPSVDLPFQLEHISGLDNYSLPHRMMEKRSDYAASHGISEDAAVSHATTGSGPSASYLGSDMRASYYGGTALTGAGQTVGLFEFLGTDLADLTTYYKNVGQTEPFTPKLVSVDTTSTSCTCSSKNATTCENGTTTTSCDDGEQTLDMTQAMGMAPGLTGLTMYIGGTDSTIISAMTTNEDGPLPNTIGCSWGWTPADPSTLDTYFKTMAAQGQNFFAASGDSSTWSSSNEAWPADDAYVVSVGGTDLVTSAAAGPWSSETAWTDSGGGITPDSIAIPSWQSASGVVTSSNKGSTTLRNGPDVSANANFTFYTCADQTTCQANVYGGTSFAAPMWAGYIALVNQQYAANNPSATVKSVGFIDPIIYPIGLGSSYKTDFHDITSGTSGSYSAVAGFDLVTGWGTPNGVNLINALAGSSTGTGTFSLSASGASVTDGSTGTSAITETVSNGFDSAVTLTASGLPSGVTAVFSPTSITGAGTSTLIFTASSTAAAGNYTITVTGTPASGTAETATLPLTVSATATPNFTVTDSPTSLSISGGGNGTSTITITSKNSFSAATTLTATGLPTGVTAAFSPSSVTPAANGTATSTLTLTASSTTTVGSATVTVTGTSGSLANSTSLSLTITSSGGGGGAQTAVYNSTLLAPGCATVGTSCDSGPSLLLGRGNMSGGAEPNQPNTINNSCADGTSGTFHSAESNDRIVVASTNGGALTQGQSVTVTATVWAYNTSDHLDIYYTANANSPSWVLAKTITPTASGAQTLSTTYTLPTGSLQAVRANFRYEQSAAVCTTGSYDDHDDLIFAVQSAGTSSFSLSATSASVTDGSTGTSTITEAVTNGFNSAVTLSASGLPTGVTAAFSPASITGAGTSTLTFTAASTATAGSYTVTVTGTPASGTAETTTLTLTVSATATPSFSLSATSASVTDGSTGTSTITEAVTNGFNSTVTLSASGMPSGITAAFNPTSITGAGASTLTFTASSTATPGTYTVTVTGTPASGAAETTNLTLTVGASGSSTTYTLIAEPAAGLTPIYNLVSSAKKTIDITMYALQDTTFTSLLATAASNGVTVRVILDQNAEKSNNTAAYNYLTANNVSVHWANPTYTYTHQKTITVDGTTSSIQTLNLQSQYYATSREYAVITNDAADVAAIETTFNADFVNGTITPPDGDNLVWSPTNSRSALTALINGANTSLMIEQEEMADTGIESALESALARGVAITLVQENESSDYNTILTTLKNDGAKIAVYTSSTGYYIHAKVVLADYGTSAAKLFVGSENFSTNSLNNNRELGLIFSDTASMTAVDADIVSDYNGGTKY